MKLFLICILLLRGNVGASDVSEIEILKTRFETLEKEKTEFSKRIETLEKEKTEFLMRIETLEKNNAKDVEERLENLEELSKIKILRTCAELQQHGIDRNGIFLVDPDGELIGEEPIYVYCNFDEGTTEVMHDMEELMKIEKCETGPGCSVYNLTYSAPKSQIKALVQLSSSCTQVGYFFGVCIRYYIHVYFCASTIRIFNFKAIFHCRISNLDAFSPP